MRANGTVSPSAKPMIISRMMSPWPLCFSSWRFSLLLWNREGFSRVSDWGSVWKVDILVVDSRDWGGAGCLVESEEAMRNGLVAFIDNRMKN